MPPFASILGLLLAISFAGNLWLFHSRDKALASAAQHKTAYEGALGAANLCSASVAELSAKSEARHAETLRRLAAQSGQVRGLEQAAIEAMQARPSDPGDLCGSLAAFLKTEIAKEKGVKP
ncbi:MAG: hypothetical protein B6D47_08525 [Rhodocyclaceae bacterium UTPRO2]|jgi:predicted outer membrane lipoprotein|nr:MAG: hypothetical protein B6D47_08525 [Rhodocyclaceae bacterium UTPRO2]